MIEKIKKNDFFDILRINNSATSKLTTIEQIEKDYETDPFYECFIYRFENVVCGFCQVRFIYENIDIVNIVVDCQHRRKGMAFDLMSYVIKYGKENNFKNITLEVNKDNNPAMKLYEKLGFEKVAIREKYYDGTDGILMEKKLR